MKLPRNSGHIGYWVGLLFFFLFMLACSGKRVTSSVSEAQSRSLEVGQTGIVNKDTPQPAGSDKANPSAVVPEGRKLIYTAQVELSVPDPTQAARHLEEKLISFEAYASSQEISPGSITFEIRVPVQRFQEFLSWLDTLGKVKRKNLQAQDVTDQYYDLENRVKNKRILLEQYQAYLKNAKNVEELLQVERFVNETISELERLEGQFRGLTKQVNYSTITLILDSEVPVRTGEPGLWEQLRTLIASYSYVLQRILLILVGIVLYGIPLLAIGILLWLLLFGRIGVLRKLFRLVSAESRKDGR